MLNIPFTLVMNLGGGCMLPCKPMKVPALHKGRGELAEGKYFLSVRCPPNSLASTGSLPIKKRLSRASADQRTKGPWAYTTEQIGAEPETSLLFFDKEL